MNVKQVIVIRRDLKMRRGKEIAQGAHASMAWLTKRLRRVGGSDLFFEVALNDEEQAWVEGLFTKVTVYVESEAELRSVHEAAVAAGLQANLITDSGKTEFHGVPTPTCAGIGPDEAEKIDRVTGHLKLY